MQLDIHQQKAIDYCTDISKRYVAVSGQAGTGKTTIIKLVFNALVGAGYNVVLCAPTGKAAKRITEATGIPASTVHRLLEFTHPGDPDPKTGKPIGFSFPRRDDLNPLEADVVICDEYAMVSHEMHRSLMKAIKPGGLVRAFGDIRQLSPIENNKKDADRPESVFRVAMNRPDSVVLENVYRQSEGSDVVTNAARILVGQIPRDLEDCKRTVTDVPLDVLRNFLLESPERIAAFMSVDNQIITPTRKGYCGTVRLNAMLQTVFRPYLVSSTGLLLPRHPWNLDKKVPLPSVHIGDKIIVQKNQYEIPCDNATQGVFNGETGIITDIIGGTLIVDLGDRIAEFPSEIKYKNHKNEWKTYDPRMDIDLAYVITTHKSQGSEYNEVIYIMSKSAGMLRCRRNFYTGVTRARNKCYIISDQASLSYSVFNEDSNFDKKRK